MTMRTAFRPASLRRGDARSGFMLVEALATMAISAFLIVALGSAVAMMTRAGERSGALSREIEATSRAVDAIGRDLGVAARVRWAGSGAGFVFAGTPTRLVFARRFAGLDDLRLVSFSAEDGRLPQVVRSDAAFPPAANGPGDIPSGVLSQAYAGRLPVRFAYFSRLPTGEEALLDTWDVATEMPSAVRIALLDPATGGIRSSVRIPLMIDAEPGCAAPRVALCSYVANGEADALDAGGVPSEPVRADDPLGWARYAR